MGHLPESSVKRRVYVKLSVIQQKIQMLKATTKVIDSMLSPLISEVFEDDDKEEIDITQDLTCSRTAPVSEPSNYFRDMPSPARPPPALGLAFGATVFQPSMPPASHVAKRKLSVGSEVLYQCNATDRLLKAKVTAISADDYRIVINDTNTEVSTVESRLIY